MDPLIQLGALLATLGAALPAVPAQTMTTAAPADAFVTAHDDAAAFPIRVHPLTAPAAPGEDKFRHAAMSWTVAAFTYAAARAAERDGDTALMIALPLSAAAGLGKEFADRRRGGPFSGGDLLADAVGIALAYLVLREVH